MKRRDRAGPDRGEDPRLEALRNEVFARYTDPTFLHHEWYVKHHVELVARIAHELLDLHPDADARQVEVLVWLHDIGKTLHPPDALEGTPAEAARLLRRCGFEPEFIETVAENLRVLDRKEHLDRACIEVRIVSSADGCAHLVGPFMMIYWRENPTLSIEALMEENRRKAMRGWDQKIVLPEARSSFQARYQLMLELTGVVPDRFFRPLDAQR